MLVVFGMKNLKFVVAVLVSVNTTAPVGLIS